MTLRRVGAAVKRLHLNSTLSSELPVNLLEGQSQATEWKIEEFGILAEDLTTSGRPLAVFGVCLHSAMPIQVSDAVMKLSSSSSEAVARLAVITPGYKPQSVASQETFPGGDHTIDGVRLIIADSTTQILRGVSVANHQPIQSAVVSNVDTSSAPGALGVNLPNSGANAGVTTVT